MLWHKDFDEYYPAVLTLGYIIIHILSEKGTYCPKFLVFIFVMIISTKEKRL